MALTNIEFQILAVLLSADGDIVDYRQLASAIWGTSHDAAVRNRIQAHISALRRKLDDPFGTRSIHAVYGVGYRMG